jgi:peptide/nickel transport system substrate-binding protein
MRTGGTIVRSRLSIATAVVAGLVALTACGGGGAAPSSASGPTGEPVSGGTGRILISGGDPRGLDPALLSNEAALSASVGNALYGQLITNNPATREVSYVLAEDLTSTDAGQTFTLKLKPGIVYSDGTPMHAEDVKFNWEHTASPATTSSYGGNAREISGMQVIDDRTLTITLRNPNAQFPAEIWETSLNWIGKPETIQAGTAQTNTHPIGAGPFTLQEWRRQDVIALVRNDRYFDKPRPYLDRLEIRVITNDDQRLNTIVSGGADLAQETQFPALARAEQQGLQVVRTPIGGGVALVLNNKKAPFDDVRARRALSYALDLDLINDAVNEGTGTVPNTLFPQGSPYFRDIPIHRHDPAQAQTLLNELAAEGKPLNFTLSIYSSPGSQRLAQSMQTQFSTLKNISMTTRVIDLAQQGQMLAARDFDSLTSSIPDSGLWIRLRGGAGNNYSGVDDPQLNAALDASRRTTDPGKIATDYEIVQQRLAEITPVIFYTGVAPAAVANSNVGGLTLYGKGAPLLDRLWIQH